MKRKQRTRILIDGPGALRTELATQIALRYKAVDLEAPNDGLVMVRMRDPARSATFHLGEVLVTEAKVQVEGVTGLGIVVGDHPETARELAIIDAAWNARLPETADWDAKLRDSEAEIYRGRLRESARLSETRVRFETMDVG
jgi:alpha-D-ribose 1-methylphosphonate 5-triphosphate synthase subunit PhnG